MRPVPGGAVAPSRDALRAVRGTSWTLRGRRSRAWSAAAVARVLAARFLALWGVRLRQVPRLRWALRLQAFRRAPLSFLAACPASFQGRYQLRSLLSLCRRDFLR